MKKARTRVAFVLAGGLVTACLLAQDLRREEANDSRNRRGIANWAAPAFWSSGQTAQGEGDGAAVREKAALPLITSPVPFIAITPCRIVDTRNASYPAGYGPPQLSAGVPRSFKLAGQCGIPDGAEAVSLNITVVGPLGLGYVLLYPEGGAQPNVSTLNFTAGQTLANAAIVPLGSGGSGGGITVAAALSNTELLIDTNGYYAAAGVGAYNTFLGVGAGNFTMTGDENTAIGFGALDLNTTGSLNIAVGTAALLVNTTGNQNTANGGYALFGNTEGSGNTAIGNFALSSNTTGGGNVAIGSGTLSTIATSSSNIAIGYQAGTNLEVGEFNIYLANNGLPTESYTTRIGAGQTRAFIDGIRGVTTGSADAVPVVIDSNGQLGTTSSSVRYKADVEDMAEASSALLKLRPVTFRYKSQAQGGKQFGLIAEEVEEVLPELVVRNAAGEVETVLYHQMPAMLLNELQKQEKHIELQDADLQAQRKRLTEVLAELEAVRAQLRTVMESR